MAQTKTGYIYGCRGIVVTALNQDGSPKDTPEPYGVKTAQTASVELQYEEGEQSVLRGGDQILAVAEDEDVVIGANLTFTNAKFDAQATEIIAGGTLITSGGDPNGWEAPKISDQGSRVPFKAELYAANYTSAGVVDGYVKITLSLCYGRVSSVSIGDREWSTPELSVKARENSSTSESCYRKEFVDSLPSELQ